LLGDLPVDLVAAADLPDVPDVLEDGETFAENATKKACAIALATGLPTVADDSGLCVDALNGDPGVHSARFAGEGHDDRANNRKLLASIACVPTGRRTARFCCAAALATPESAARGEAIVREGSCEGVILDEARGTSGFGYDPLFLYEPEGLTFAELPLETKNALSHRARAFAALLPAIRDLVSTRNP
jgi:XTP/dITP diphosphohydrolase